MPYITIDAEVEVDIDEVLAEASDKSLIRECKVRGMLIQEDEPNDHWIPFNRPDSIDSHKLGWQLHQALLNRDIDLLSAVVEDVVRHDLQYCQPAGRIQENEMARALKELSFGE